MGMYYKQYIIILCYLVTQTLHSAFSNLDNTYGNHTKDDAADWNLRKSFSHCNPGKLIVHGLMAEFNPGIKMHLRAYIN